MKYLPFRVIVSLTSSKYMLLTQNTELMYMYVRERGLRGQCVGTTESTQPMAC